jgi:hypothetical protein
MKNDYTISIPLVSFSSSRKGRESGHERGEKILYLTNYIRISPPMELPDNCYGVRIENENQSTFLVPGSLAVFSKNAGPALEKIFAVAVKNEFPFLGKLMKNESSGDGASTRRKVFMVPTPLHVPEDKVSPIADSLHHVLLIKDLKVAGKLKMISSEKILWKHPLVYVESSQS